MPRGTYLSHLCLPSNPSPARTRPFFPFDPTITFPSRSLVTNKQPFTPSISRLPRRYSNDKNRDTTAPIVGTSGSTPLHFASANGHTEVISTLLKHGALPDRADKHGVTPEMLARQNGWLECADLLRDWVSSASTSKDRDVGEGAGAGAGEDGEREKEVEKTEKTQERSWCPLAVGDGESPRVIVKRSIECTLLKLKSSVNNLSEANLHRPSRAVSPGPSASYGTAEPSSPFGDYSFYPMAPHSSDDVSSRRPSLPHIFEDTPKKPKTTSKAHTRRPRSAGTDAESHQTTTPAAPATTTTTTTATPTRKLSTKYSLLNLFRRPGESSSSPTPERSFSASPTPGTGANTPSTSPQQLPQSLSSDSSHLAKNRSRMGSDASTPSAVELHYALSTQQSKEGTEDGNNSPSTRPGILRAHGRSSSSQTPIQQRPQSPYRALRFESASALFSSYTSKHRARMGLRHKSSSPARGLRSRSSSSLRSAAVASAGGVDGPGPPLPPPPPPSSSEMEVVNESLSTGAQEFEDVRQVDMDEDEEEYGKPLPKSSLTRTDHRPTVRSSSPLSPIMSARPSTGSPSSEFPFSINQPPPDDDGESHDQLLAVPQTPTRPRGQSVSTMSSDGSVANPQLSLSGTTANSSNGSSFLSLPGSRSSMATAKPDDIESGASTLERTVYSREEGIIVSGNGISTGLNERRSHAPLDINIRSISSHAQAEALVQQAQQDILNMNVSRSPDRATPSSAGHGGWTPLSARLAAYGESLALERRLKKEEEQRALANHLLAEPPPAPAPPPPPPPEEPEETGSPTLSVQDALYDLGATKGSASKVVGGARQGRRRLDRKLSLEQKSKQSASNRSLQPKRPNTAGEAPREPPCDYLFCNLFFLFRP
jgi:hypothetical protein